ncbi:MAG: hypothetical protein R3F61_38000 [Myxococcota bacterium]
MLPDPSGPTLRALRGLVLATGLAFILLVPGWVQILGGRPGPFVRPWRMYSGVGRDLCEVRYEQRLPDGRSVAVDRLEVLGLGPNAPMFQRELVGVGAVRADARRLCQNLGPAADLRATVRCAGPQGWAPAIGPEEPLCKR